MSLYVTDTHALIWHLYADPKLSPPCRAIFARADAGEDTILIPSTRAEDGAESEMCAITKAVTVDNGQNLYT